MNDHLEAWSPCPQGALAKHVSHAKTSKRKHSVALVAAVGAAVCIVLFAGSIWFGSPPSQTVPTTLTCKQVREQYEVFVAKSIDEGSIRRIEEHLARCHSCRDWYANQITSFVRRSAIRIVRSRDHSHCPCCERHDSFRVAHNGLR